MPAFQVRDYSAIAGEMLAQLVALTVEITDLTEGAVGRAILETVARELQRLDAEMYQGVRQGIETGTYQNFEFFRLPATYASGLVTFSLPTGSSGIYTIPVGTTVQVPGSGVRAYQTIAAATLGPAPTVDVGVRCLSPGAQGNTAAHTITVFSDPNNPLIGANVTVSNPQTIFNGVDQESDADRRVRFRLYIQSLSRGTRLSIQYAALSCVLTDAQGNAIERVTGAYVREPFRDEPHGRLGLVEVYIDNGSGTASPALVTEVQNTLRGYVAPDNSLHRGWVAAGIDCVVYPVTPILLDVSGTAIVSPSFDAGQVQQQVTDAVVRYVGSLQVFQTLIFAELVTAVMLVDGVTDVRFDQPTANVPISYAQRIVPGVVTMAVSQTLA